MMCNIWLHFINVLKVSTLTHRTVPQTDIFISVINTITMSQYYRLFLRLTFPKHFIICIYFCINPGQTGKILLVDKDFQHF